MLANLYLHYVLDLWVKAWRKKLAHGDVIIVRYADDAVLGFQHREDAERFLEQLRERLRKFGLELHPEKTRLIEFGRYATERREKRGEGKPETFNFLGFTHICGTNHKTGNFTVQRKTIGKRMAAKLKDIESQAAAADARSLPGHGEVAAAGGARVFPIPRGSGQQARLKAFRNEVLRIWLRTLRRRSQRSRWTWERFRTSLGSLLPRVQILHPYPDVRFDAKHPKSEVRTVCVSSASTGLCGGQSGNWLSLPRPAGFLAGSGRVHKIWLRICCSAGQANPACGPAFQTVLPPERRLRPGLAAPQKWTVYLRQFLTSSSWRTVRLRACPAYPSAAPVRRPRRARSPPFRCRPGSR